jgi:hypothetical protein
VCFLWQYQESIDFSTLQDSEFDKFQINSSDIANLTVHQDLARLRGLSSNKGMYLYASYCASDFNHITDDFSI